MTNPAETDGVVPLSVNTISAATISAFANNSGQAQALPGFVPGIFAYTFAIPPLQQQAQFGITLRSSTSQSQNLYIYVR